MLLKVSDEYYINNLLTLLMWKCVYAQIVYLNIFKKKVSIFFQKSGFKGGGTMLPGGGIEIFFANFAPPPLHKFSRTPLVGTNW